MRLFLLPISTRRTLLYCERSHQKLPSEVSYVDKVTNKASETWANWEREEKGWKKSVTSYGNKLLRRIPYAEWGLKTVPKLNDRRKEAYEQGKSRVEVLFPGAYLKEERIGPILQKLATERQALHKKRLIWSIVGMPISAPFALIPIIPNLPFFYLVFRAYSHWKALTGSRHLEYLTKNRLVDSRPSRSLDEVYTAGLIYPTRQVSRDSPIPSEIQIEEVTKIVEDQTHGGAEDAMVLQRWNGKLIAERFKLPEMEVEIERAVEQVENAIKAREELLEEKQEIEEATAQSTGKSKAD